MTIKDSNQNGDMEWMRLLTRFNQKPVPVIDLGGCNGNLQGISQLVRGQRIDDVIPRLNGIRCGAKSTSCPDQLCRALEQLKQAPAKE